MLSETGHRGGARAWRLALAVALGLAALGCGEAEELTPRAASAAAAKTVAAGTARISQSDTIALPGRRRLSVSWTGLLDIRNHRGQVSFFYPRVAPDGVTVREEFQAVFDRKSIWLRWVGRRPFPGRKRWLKLQYERLRSERGDNAVPTSDPLDGLELLRNTRGSAAWVGEDEIRGVPTSIYTKVVNHKRVGTVARDAIRRIAGSDVSSAAVNAWVDDKGFVRRVENAFTARIEGRRAEIVQRVEYFDFGAPVRIKFPAPEETFDPEKPTGDDSGEAPLGRTPLQVS